MIDFKNKKIQYIIYIVFMLGIALLLFGRVEPQTTPIETPQQNTDSNLEQRLQETLSFVQGVGEVRVIINYQTTPQKVIARDRTEETGENTKRFEETVVMGNDNQPVVLMENTQKVQGVIIVAQGGGNIEIKNQLISATMAFLGVEAHKIEVLKMKS